MFQSLITLDKSITNTINGLQGLNPFLDTFGVFVSEYLIFAIGIAAGVWALGQKRRVSVVAAVVCAAALSQIGKFVIASFYFRNRPGAEHLFNSIPYDASFPSGHTAGAFALAFTVLLFSRWNSKLGWTLFVSSFLVAYGRVFEGVHYVSDTIGGFVLGWCCAWLAYTLFSRIKKRDGATRV